MSAGTVAASSVGDVALLLVVALVVWLPGGLAGGVAGLRGWTLAASAPLLTYGVIGLIGPASSLVGVRWSAVPLVIGTAVTVVVCALLVRLVPRPAGETSPWRPVAHIAVAACVTAAGALAARVIVRGMGDLRTIPQDWDAVFHANGTRWIVENGDAGLHAMARVNAYELPGGAFYPNAYHLGGAVVAQLSGRDIPSVLNTKTVVTVALLALGVAALVRRFGGRAVHAGAAALVAVAATSFYDMLWRGPLLPFAMGAALLPAGLILTADLLDAAGIRDRVRRGAPFVLGLGGALALHPGIMVTLVVLALPLAAARVSSGPRRAARDVGAVVTAGVVTAFVYGAQLVSSLGSAADEAFNWAASHSVADAVGQILMFSHESDAPQWWLAIALLLGLVMRQRLGRLRWVPGAALVVGGLFVAAASYDAQWAETLTQPWWNDHWRLAGVIVIPLAVLAGHGVAETARAGTYALDRAIGRWLPRTAGLRVTSSAAVAVLVLSVLTATTGGLYLQRNEAVMQRNTGDGPAVSAGEVAGYEVLATMVAPNERVMNDRGDGSAWMYAIAGVHPVAAHYSDEQIGPDARLLADRFDDYAADAAVRAAAARLNVRWAVVGDGFLRETATRQPGLIDIDRSPALHLVWSNRVFRIYQLLPR